MDIRKNMNLEEFVEKISGEKIGSVYVENFESNIEDTGCSVEINAFDLNDIFIASHRISSLNQRNLASRVSMFIEEHFHDEKLDDLVIYEHDFDL